MSRRSRGRQGLLPPLTPAPSSLTGKVLVLDLDETIIHSFSDYGELAKTLGTHPRVKYFSQNDLDSTRQGNGYSATMSVFVRPGLCDFLRFAFVYFRAVGIFTAGLPKYGYDIPSIATNVAKLCPQTLNTGGTFHFYLTRDDIDTKTELWEKPLEKVVDALHERADRIGDPRLIDFWRDVTLNNVLILDDRNTAFCTSYPGNGVIIPPYEPTGDREGLEAKDEALSQFQAWLERPDVMREDNVTKLDKTGIFA